MRLLGVYGGIGSPAVLASRKGHKVVGNIEPRSFAHMTDEQGRNTFLDNFYGAWLVRKVEEVNENDLKNIDIIFGHPKCGAYSNLINKSGQARIDHAKKTSDEFLEFIRITSIVKPKMAFFDNLPKSLEANPPSLYRDLLPDYDVSIEYVSNYFYGNCQPNRNRLFIIATLKDLNYEFMPGEEPNDLTLRDVIGDLEGCEGQLFNHDRHNLDAKSNKGRRVYQETTMTWAQVQQTFKEKLDNKALHYFTEDGEKKYHFGLAKPKYDKGAPTLMGSNSLIHPVTNLPMSIRERARIMGFPDDFNFYGTKFEPDGTWVHNKNGNMIKQTGRCIPCEFPDFLIDQFDHFLHNKPNYLCSFQRLAKKNKFIEKHLI